MSYFVGFTQIALMPDKSIKESNLHIAARAILSIERSTIITDGNRLIAVTAIQVAKDSAFMAFFVRETIDVVMSKVEEATRIPDRTVAFVKVNPDDVNLKA